MMKKSLISVMKSGASFLRPRFYHQHHYLKPDENKALQDLKQMFNSSYKNKQVSMWGVPLTTTSSETTTIDKSDSIFLRFLRAKEFSVEKSYNMLRKCLSWRKEFGVDSIDKEDLGFKELKGSNYSNGFDRKGRRVWYQDYEILKNKNIFNKLLENDEDSRKFVRWCIQDAEREFKMMHSSPKPNTIGINSVTQIIDGKDYNGSYMTPEYKAACKEARLILSKNYPGMVYRSIYINLPWYRKMIATMFFSLFSRRQIARVQRKFVFAKEGDAYETLLKYIRPEHIPIQYGGLSRPGELNNIPPKPVSEFTVEGGEIAKIPIEGVEAGAIITWDVAVGGWDLEYRAEFVPSAVGRNIIVVDAPRKMKTTDLALHNYYIPQEAGKLVLFIDNRSSRKSKVVAYRYLIQQSENKLLSLS